jgi:hypothetical protein
MSDAEHAAAIAKADAYIATLEPGTPQWEAARTAKQLLSQSHALDQTREREQPRAEAFDAEAVEKRGRWLQAAAMHEPARRLGRDLGTEVITLPNGALALATRDGEEGPIKTLAPVLYGVEDIAPGDWDRLEAVSQHRARVAENEMLARAFGADVCVKADVMTAEEAAALDPVASRYVKPMRGLEGL